MSQLAILTARELRAHVPLAGMAAAAALLPWMAPWLPGFSGHPPADVRQATAAVVAVLVGGGLAVLVGSGLVSRDLAEGRLGFFLTLPVRAATIWLARLLAGSALVYGAIALILIPAVGSPLGLQQDAVLFGLPVPRQAIVLVETSPRAGLLILPLALMLVAHQLAVALRARTPWLLVEAVGFGAGLLLAINAYARLSAAAAWSELSLGAGLGLALVLFAMAAGGAAGLSRGAAMLARFHRAQALTATAGVLAAALGTAWYAHWVLAPTSGDVASVETAEVAPRGEWIAARVSLDHRPSYQPWALYHRGRGSWLPLAPSWGGDWNAALAPIVFAADGRSALWRGSASRPGMAGSEIVWIDLAGSAPSLVETSLVVPFEGNMALSEDGGKIGVRGRGKLAIWADGGNSLLAAASVPDTRGSWGDVLRFVEGSLRLVSVGHGPEGLRLQVRELDPELRRLREAPDVPLGAGGEVTVTLSAAGDRLLVGGGLAPTTLHDGSTGVLLREVAPAGWSSGVRPAVFLADGRIVVPVDDGEGLALRLLTRDGATIGTLPLGAGRSALPLSEWRRDAVLVSVRTAGGWELWEADFGAGKSRLVTRDLLPPRKFTWALGPLPPPGGETIVWASRGRSLEALDPAGNRAPVLPAAPGP